MSDTTAPVQTLAEILSNRQRGGERITFTVTADWGQGRTTFGGLLAALAVQAMRDVCGSDWPLRALQTNFVGPVAPGQVRVDVSLLRQGKNIRQVQAHVTQTDEQGQTQVGGVLLGVFGGGRDSALPLLRPSQPPVPVDHKQAFRWPYIPNMMPAFTQHMDIRHADGGMPFTGSSEWHSRAFVRLHKPEG